MLGTLWSAIVVCVMDALDAAELHASAASTASTGAKFNQFVHKRAS